MYEKIYKGDNVVLITSIVVSVVSVSAAVHFNSENIAFEPEDTNWNVSNTNSALNDLYDTSNTKITNFKTTIAQAITDMGVTTEEDADAETMANNIKNISSLESNTSKLEVIKKWYGTAWNRTKSTGTISFTCEKKGTYILVAGGNNVWDNYSYITINDFEQKGENMIAEKLDGWTMQEDHTTVFMKECEVNETHTFTWFITAWNNVGGLEVTLIYVP